MLLAGIQHYRRFRKLRRHTQLDVYVEQIDNLAIGKGNA